MSKRLRWYAAGTVVALVAVGASAWWFVLRDTAPAEVSTEAGLAQLQSDLEAHGTDGSSRRVEPLRRSIEGSWVIDDEFGDFAFENASGSFAGFRVEERYAGGLSRTAIGRTGGVSGSFTVHEDGLVDAEVVVDMAQLQSDVQQRTTVVRDTLDVNRFPEARFRLSQPIALDLAALRSGETVAVEMMGELTIMAVTNQVTLTAEATVPEPGVGLVAVSSPITFADYDVPTPDTAIADIDGSGTLEIQLVVRPT